MKKPTIEEQKLLKLLIRRCERLLEEYDLDAPALIKKVEVDLIIDAASKMKNIYNKIS